MKMVCPECGHRSYNVVNPKYAFCPRCKRYIDLDIKMVILVEEEQS